LIQREGVRIYVAYLDKDLSRRVRRVPLNVAVQSPTLKEVEDACRALGYQFTSIAAKHSAAWWTDVGAVEVSGVRKQVALKNIAQEVFKARGIKNVKKS